MKKLYFSEEEMIKFLAYDYKDADFAEYVEEENKVIIPKSKMNELIIDKFFREIDFNLVQDYIKDEKIEIILEKDVKDLDKKESKRLERKKEKKERKEKFRVWKFVNFLLFYLLDIAVFVYAFINKNIMF